ncbi:DNA-directed RNA polymerase III subunit RPC6 [Gurleya vavrai]
MLLFIHSKDGVSETDLIDKFPSLTKTQITAHLNTFLRNKQIELYNNGNDLIYKKISSAIEEERIIYQLISQSKGLWLRDIKLRTSIPQNLINKILKQMENKKMIKSLKSVKNNRKVYVLYDDKPNEELTGGVWFNEGDVDNELVDEISKIIYSYICKKCLSDDCVQIDNLLGPSEILKFIEDCKVMNVQLNLNDVELMMKTMVYDGLIQEINLDDGLVYRPLKKI